MRCPGSDYSDRVKRVSWHAVAAVVLLALLSALATLQYRWLGEISRAERDRMLAASRSRISAFASDFNSEVTKAVTAFSLDEERFTADPIGTLAQALDRWQSSAAAPDLFKDVYVLEVALGAAPRLQRFDRDRRTLDPRPLPAGLDDIGHRAGRGGLPLGAVLASPGFPVGDDESGSPALVVAVPRIRLLHTEGLPDVPPPGPARGVVLRLNESAVRRELLEPLVARHFGSGEEYAVAVVRRDRPETAVYAWPEGATVGEADADASAGLFEIRLEDLSRMATELGLRRSGAGRQVAIALEARTGDGSDNRRVVFAGAPGQGIWQARVRYRAGSLETIVAQSRRRNLAISGAILGLLAASFALVMASAARRQRLARQQLEFVAAVTHDLRTPLAVIRAAGENLSDGVVGGDDQIRQYGSLIATEGRRLTDMVERVMAYAGITSGVATGSRADIDVAAILEEAAGAARMDARDRGVDITVRVEAGRPPIVAGDAQALRSAIQNVVDNAVKYSPKGGAVDVVADAGDAHVRIRIADRGIGIDDDELPHIFEPFFRGRRAVDAQIRGTGVGLSVVRHVVDAHGGRIDVQSQPGEGTSVTLEFPRVAG